jgi:hypothetical protein
MKTQPITSVLELILPGPASPEECCYHVMYGDGEWERKKVVACKSPETATPTVDKKKEKTRVEIQVPGSRLKG